MTLQSLYQIKPLDNDRGSVLPVTLIMLCLLTLLGVAATNTSTFENQIAIAEREKMESFYAAEAGVDHVSGILRNIFVQRNAAKIAAGQDPDWDFALNGSVEGVGTASGADYGGGVVWINSGSLGGNYTYSVRVWNNSDGGDATNDTDGKIYVRSEASRAGGGNTSIEVTLRGSVSGGDSVTGYNAQAGAGPGKSFTSDDLDAISDFSVQLGA
jgi:type IV pilus assembly protein PilX